MKTDIYEGKILNKQQTTRWGGGISLRLDSPFRDAVRRSGTLGIFEHNDGIRRCFV